MLSAGVGEVVGVAVVAVVLELAAAAAEAAQELTSCLKLLV
jgi:hypothetical protein